MVCDCWFNDRLRENLVRGFTLGYWLKSSSEVAETTPAKKTSGNSDGVNITYAVDRPKMAGEIPEGVDQRVGPNPGGLHCRAL